ncbi:MAG: cache domain-containing protein [Treponema sp.]|nr:cache domain-containing protein [Treponema sp.]
MKLKLNLSTKIAILAALAIIVSSVSVGICSINVSKKQLRGLITESVETTELGVLNTLDNWKSILEASTLVLADKTRLATALGNRDYDTANKLLEEQVKVLDTDFLVVTDESGKVVAGGKYGVNLSDAYAVNQALKGSKEVSYEVSDFFEYSLISAYPIKSNGRIVGTVVGGYSLVNPEFVEEIKRCFKVECTIFHGNERVSTTLGQSFIGKKLDNQDIVNHVLKNGERFNGTNKIGSNNYFCVYAPLKDNGGNISGMLFVAKDTEVEEAAVLGVTRIIVPVIIVLVVILVIIATLFLRSLLKPLIGVKVTLEDISSGDADLTKRIEQNSDDEIGDVVNGFNKFAGKLQHIIGDVKTSKDDLLVAGEDLSSATQDTASSITEIIANIESMKNQIGAQNQSVSSTAGAVNEIASNIESLERMIESQSAGVTQASAAVEEMIGNITSVNSSVEKMAISFDELRANSQTGISKQQAVNERISQIESQSQMLQDANVAIASIAAQTNLLAMNAAIEAAHAGEAGKGFAVVADEIRKLSETSTAQSKTIGDQLNNIKESINDVVSASSESSIAFEAVSRKLEETDALVIHIKSAMEEQNEGSKQITEALHSMNDSTVEVRNASSEMQEGNQMILEEVKQLQNATTQMTQSMEEMSVGARKINETGAALTNVSNQMKDSIGKIGVQVDQFKV